MVSFNKLYEPSNFFSKDSCFVENKRDRSFGLEFYNTMAGTVGIVCCTAFTVSLFYLMQRYRKGKRKEIREKATSCSVPSLASSY